jgi:hypothetical protein
MKVSTKLATIKSVPATAMAKAMTKAIKAEPAVTGHKDAAVTALIGEAIAAAGTMVAKVREAAKAAAAQFNPAASPNDNVKRVVAMYADDFAGDANVKALFSDALWLLAANSVPVTVMVGKEAKHVSAGDAIDMAKHGIKAAASQARKAHGAGRVAGAGRKPAGKVASPTQPTAASKVASKKAGPVMTTPAEDVWLQNLAAFLSDPDMIAKIKAVCSENGFTLSKKPAKK